MKTQGSRLVRPHQMMAAVVLGTALSTLGMSGHALAETPPDEVVQDISRYCTVCWRNARLAPDRWTDCTQEVFVRLLERVPGGQWLSALRADGQERRELLRAIDAVKKRTQRSHKYAGLGADVADHRSSEREWRDEREWLDKASREVLSERQQRIMQMSLAGSSVGEIAVALHTTTDRVSDEKYKAINKLRRLLNPPDGEVG